MENISSWELIIGAFAILFLVSLIRMFLHIRQESRKVLQKLAEQQREATDDVLDAADAENKAQFKKDIFDCYKTEQLRNMEKLKSKMLKEILFEQSIQFEKLKREALIRIIRKVISEFRSRFFKNLQQALIAQVQKKKGRNGKLSQMQKEAIFEVENQMEEKSKRHTDEKERNESKRQEKAEQERIAKEKQKESQEREKQEKSRKKIEKLRQQKEQQEKEKQTKNQKEQEKKEKEEENKQQEQKKRQVEKPREIQKAAIQAGYRSNRGKGR